MAKDNEIIGLYFKSGCYINANLSNNIGSFDGTYDGFATPIGERVDIYYNTDNVTPTFKTDIFRNDYDNYIDYVEHVYFLSSIDKLYNERMYPLTPERITLDKVGYVDGYSIMGGYTSSNLGMTLDTFLGKLNNLYLSHTLVSSAYNTSERLENYDKSVTNDLSSYFGLNANTMGNITQRFSFSEKGRVNTDIGIYGSPVGDAAMYGNVFDMSAQETWVKSLSTTSLRFLARAIHGYSIADSEFNSTITDASQLFFNAQTALADQSKNYVNRVLTKGGNFASPQDGGITSEEVPYRYVVKGTTNSTSEGKTHNTYAEYENGSHDIVGTSFNEGVNFSTYDSTRIVTNDTVDDLLNKTNTAFKNNKYRTLIARFHTSNVEETEGKATQSAISTKYGMSHGRNLLKVDPTDSYDYDNPYCRVWTYHFQYRNLISLIRPFVDGGDYESAVIVTNKDLSDSFKWKYMANQFDDEFDGVTDGRTRLGKYTVLNQNNGMINIAPTNKFIDGEDKAVDIKNCMFSIENLAWKGFREGEYGLSPEQKGPMGGRIMWFPPYDLTFQENVNVNWNENEIIGRGENIYTYINTLREGNLSFRLLVDHPSIIDYYKKSSSSSSGDTVDDLESDEQRLLRFFAGCEVLEATPNQITSGNINNDLDLPELPERPVPDVPTKTITNKSQIQFFVFYPNNYSGIDDEPNQGSIVNSMHYLANGIGCQMSLQSDTNRLTDFAVPLQPYTDLTVGGYEISNSEVRGVSLSGSEVLKGVPTSEARVYSSSSSSKPKRGRDYNIEVDGIKLMTQYVNPNKFGGLSEWYYRVDRAYEGQKLLSGNYVDNKSFGLNQSKGLDFIYQNLLSRMDKVTIGENLFSFIDIFCALDPTMHNLMTRRGIANDTHIAVIKKIFEENKITSIVGHGMASSHGRAVWNNQLNVRRFNSVASWLQTYSLFKNVSKQNLTTTEDIGDVTFSDFKTDSVNDRYAKLYRSARVIINVENESVVTLQEEKQDSATTMGESGITYNLQGVGTINVPKSIMDNVMQQYPNDKTKQERLLKEMLVQNPYQFFNYRTPEFDEKLKLWQAQAKEMNKKRESENADISSMKRYDNESNFFQSIALNDDFLHHLIKEKIKYFDPAFHSVSPEGFNARLTFLQQCTRQGSTYSANENGMNTNNASNLSFGTPPICVLRVGDFYNTKIIIKHMNITYEMWDLNQEGIGVQPMTAKVDLQFAFLGGQDLSNPVPRLQNALSFNYYKNTSVYDNRAEMVTYDDDNNGELQTFRGVKH